MHACNTSRLVPLVCQHSQLHSVKLLRSRMSGSARRHVTCSLGCGGCRGVQHVARQEA